MIYKLEPITDGVCAVEYDPETYKVRGARCADTPGALAVLADMAGLDFIRRDGGITELAPRRAVRLEVVCPAYCEATVDVSKGFVGRTEGTLRLLAQELGWTCTRTGSATELCA